MDGARTAIVAVVADGAGSACRAEIGAELAGSLFLGEMGTFYACGHRAGVLSRQFFEDWLSHFREEVRARAETEGLAPRDFACTLVAAIVEDDRAAFVQVGDGAIVIAAPADPAGYSCVFWPQRGEYANTTYFATDVDARTRLEFSSYEGRVEEIALFTDGMQSLALEYQSQTAHAPFFRPVFAPIRAGPRGHAEKLSSALASFLGSARVNARTDDDKTLILASRRKREPRRAGSTNGRPDNGERRDR